MCKEKRLIFVISSSIAGGGQIYLFNILSYLADKYSILLICPEGFLLEKVRSEIIIDTVPLAISIKNVNKLRSIIKKEKDKYGDVYINAHLLGTALWTKLALTGLREVHYTVTLHNKVLYPNMGWYKSFIFPFILKKIAKSECSFIAVSQEIADSVKQFTNKDCTYIPSSVPIKGPPVIACEKITQKENIKIGFVGRLSQLKNPIRFVEMASIVKNNIAQTQFVMIGDGEMKSEVEECITKNKLDGVVTLKGFVSNPGLEMRKLDALVISSNSEGTPLVLLESMSYGVPVVSTRVGAIPLVIEDGKDGILCDCSADSLSEGLIKLLSDCKLYKTIAAKAFEKIKDNYSYESNIQNYLRVMMK